MKKLAFLIVLLLLFSFQTVFAEDEVAVSAEVDGWAKVIWGMDLNSPISTGFDASAELTIELNFMKIDKEHFSKGSDDDGPVYGYIKFSKLTFAPEVGVYQADRNTKTEDGDFIDTGNDDILYLDEFSAKIYAKPIYVTVFQSPDVEFDKAGTVDTAHGPGVTSDNTGPMRAEVEITSGVNAVTASDITEKNHAGVTVGLDTDVFDLALKAATPWNWDYNIANAYSVGVAPSLDLADLGIPIKLSNMSWMSFGYNTYRYYPYYGGDTDGKPWDEVGIGSRIEIDMLSIMGLTEEFDTWKPAVDFDIVFPLNGDPVAPWGPARWEIGFDSDFKLAWNADADTTAEDGSRIRFEVSYSDHSKLSDLDFKLTLTEDDGNGYIDPDLEYNASVVLSDVMGAGEDFGAPYTHTMGLDFDANIEYKFYLDEEETTWIEPYGACGWDFGVLDQAEDSVLNLTFDVTAQFFPNTEFQLKYSADQLFKSQEGYTIAFDNDTQSWTATLADLAAQDIGNITFETKISY